MVNEANYGVNRQSFRYCTGPLLDDHNEVLRSLLAVGGAWPGAMKTFPNDNPGNPGYRRRQGAKTCQKLWQCGQRHGKNFMKEEVRFFGEVAFKQLLLETACCGDGRLNAAGGGRPGLVIVGVGS